jgi:predicted MPP superfamily phosphohydrolase
MQFGKGVRLVQHRLQLPNFPSAAPPLKVAFLSDLHYGPTSGRLALRQAWKLVRDAKPDAIFLGGDYLFADERGLPAFLQELQRFQFSPPPAGIYACLGNHDYYAGRETIETCLEACGVKMLINDAVPLPTPWKGVWVAGVDDLRHGTPDLQKALSNVSPDASTLLLAHEPDICADPNLRHCGITLCGHTHGGQVCLPNGDAIYVPGKAGKDYAQGLIRHSGQWLYVSRGVGTVGIPLRLFCPPEVAVFEFTGRGARHGKTTGRVIPFRPTPE